MSAGNPKRFNKGDCKDIACSRCSIVKRKDFSTRNEFYAHVNKCQMSKTEKRGRTERSPSRERSRSPSKVKFNRNLTQIRQDCEDAVQDYIEAKVKEITFTKGEEDIIEDFDEFLAEFKGLNWVDQESYAFLKNILFKEKRRHLTHSVAKKKKEIMKIRLSASAMTVEEEKEAVADVESMGAKCASAFHANRGNINAKEKDIFGSFATTSGGSAREKSKSGVEYYKLFPIEDFRDLPASEPYVISTSLLESLQCWYQSSLKFITFNLAVRKQREEYDALCIIIEQSKEPERERICSLNEVRPY